MKAVINNLQENTHVLVNNFDNSPCTLHPQDVKLNLWKVYRLAVIGKAHAVSHLSEEEIALLFDQLIKLVEADAAVHQSGGATLFDLERSDYHD